MCTFMLARVYSGTEVFCCSPKTHHTKREVPGEDDGHSEINIPHLSLLFLQFIFEPVNPDVLQTHSVLQTVAGSRPVQVEAEQKAITI